jgi:antitoxin HicB
MPGTGTPSSTAKLSFVELRYAVLLEPEPDGSAYNVIVPALPEAHTWGETVEEALAMAREVIEQCVRERQSRGEEIPPSDAGSARLEVVEVSLPAA